MSEFMHKRHHVSVLLYHTSARQIRPASAIADSCGRLQNKAMASINSVNSSRLARGVIMMTVAMLSLPLVDGLAKYLSVKYSPLFLGWARYVVACVIILPVASAIHGPRLFPAE